MGLETPEPQGAFYVFPSIGRFGLPSGEFCRRMTEALGLDLARVRELAKGDQKTLIAATLH